MSKINHQQRDRMDFEKTMGHDMDVIFDLMGITCAHVMITYIKRNTQASLRMDLVIGTTCGCNEIIPWTIRYSFIIDFLIILIIYFMTLPIPLI